MNKKNFLMSFYDSLVKDLIGAVDCILYDYHPLYPDEDFERLCGIAMKFRSRPDIFRNLHFLTRFVFFSLDFDPAVSCLLVYSEKVSPSWLSNLLIFKTYIDEFKKDNSK